MECDIWEGVPPPYFEPLSLKISVDFPVTMITSSNCLSGRKSSHTTVDKHNRLQEQKKTEVPFSASETFLY